MERVSNLNHGTVDRDEARRMSRLGRFKELEASLSERYEVWALVERGRIALQRSDLETADDYLSAAFSDASSSEDYLLSASLLDVVYASLGRPEFDRYPPLDFFNCDRETASDAVCYFALAAYIRNDYLKARKWLASHTPFLPVSRARFLLLEGQICAAADHDLIKQATLTEEALSILQSQAPGEQYSIASCAETLAHLVRELRFEAGLSRLQSLLSNSWEDCFQDAYYQMLRSVAWTYALNGDYGAALRLLEKASLVAATDLMRAFLHLDCASVAIFSRSSIHAKSSLAIANDYIRSIDHNPGKSHAVILPLTAQVSAEVGEVVRAIEYCEMAEGVKSQIARHYNLAHGPRFDAMIAEAKALAYASDDRKKAIKHATFAYDVFSPIGYAWRAGRMALFLYQMTRKTTWRERAVEHLSVYPNGPFCRMLSVGTMRRTLTLRQQEVLTLLSLGYNTKRIAQVLNRAPDTVRTHITRIHDAFGVTTRQELLARLASEGRA
jgi:DNA-binding CsgD family transcriptional regulator